MRLIATHGLFCSSQFYNAFLDRGVLVEDREGGKWAASLLPAMAFYLGASLMAQYEKTGRGVDWSGAFEGGFGVGHSVLMLLVDIVLWLSIAWYLDQVGAAHPNPHPTIAVTITKP